MADFIHLIPEFPSWPFKSGNLKVPLTFDTILDFYKIDVPKLPGGRLLILNDCLVVRAYNQEVAHYQPLSSLGYELK